MAFISFTNASTYYVDGTNGSDTNSGTSWATARKTITAANSLAGVGDNIYIKTGTYNFSSSAYGTPALSMKVDVNYYGGFVGLDSETPETRQTSDLDGNGIIEPWEFTNPTILNFIITTGGVGLSFNSSNTAVRAFNGFKITGTSSFRNTDKNSRCIAVYSNMLFENNTISNWVVTGDFMGAYMKAFFFGIEPGVNNATVNNCIFEKNEVNINSTLNDYLLDTFIRLGAATGVRGNVMSNCIVRNNKIKVDYSTSSVTTCANIRGMIIAMFAQTTPGYPTTLKNCIVHNNDMTYVPNGTALIASNGAAISVYDAGVACYDSVINCTVANNKAVKMGTGGMYIRFNSASQPYHIVLNNVLYNNTKDGAISNLVATNGSPTGVIRIANNYANGGSVTNYSTTVVDNVNDLSATNTDATKGAFFSAPSSGQGYITDGTVETSRWTIGATSYLKSNGTTSLSSIDKAGAAFGNPPSVGAYEYTSKIINVSSGDVNGSVSAGGSIDYGTVVAITGTPNNGYRFLNWTENNVIVSTDATYSFVCTTDRDLVAHFDLSTDLETKIDKNIITVEGRNLRLNNLGVAEIYDNIGRLVRLIKENDTFITLNNAGVYFIRIRSENGIKTVKIVIK